ncbi:GroES-like protein [Daldinia caldariorum]|uniref:GroES-like protein n=1 Tax=Daldinia caldariorum TaxID=326644 RepID=UPI00200821A3|nr:GroES-like protein [Daldinia caldariorum]KAI1467704.1 GroES-like protein [Daldinia caldariorum]
MSTIQVYQATKVGGPFQLITAPKPKPGAGEVTIRPKAVAINGIDWKNITFGATIQSWPAVLGIDGAGTIEEVGEGVTDFKAGDEVLSYAPGIEGKGTWQEIFVAQTNDVAKKPSYLSVEEAASLPTCFLTAAGAIIEGLKVGFPGLSKIDNTNAPKSILIVGGGSAVGSAAIQLLRLALPSVTIVVTSSKHHHERLKSLGADATLERSAQQDGAALKAASPNGAGFDAILDAVGACHDTPAVFEAIRPDGPQLYSLVLTRPGAQIPKGFNSSLVGVESAERGAMAWFSKLLEERKYKVPVEAEVVGHGWSDIPKGIARFPAQISGVKLVVTL